MSAVAARSSSATGLLEAAHPGPSAAVTVLAAAYAVSAGLTTERVVLVTAAVAAGQLFTGWTNDLLDAERDRTAAREDKPLARGDVERRVVVTAWAAAGVATVVLSLLCGWVAGLVHLALVLAALGYNLGLKSTLVSWLPYAVAFGGLPVFLNLAQPGQGPPAWWVVAAAALLGVGAHLLDVVPDLAADEATGVRGLAHALGAGRATVLAVTCLLAASVLLAVGSRGSRGVPDTAVALVLAVVALLCLVVLAGRGRTPFAAAVGIALVDVLLLVVSA